MNVMDRLAQARPASLDAQPAPARRASDLAAAIATARPDQRRPGNGTDPRRRMAWPPLPGRGITAGAVAALAGAAAAAVALTYAPATTHHPVAASPGNASLATSDSLRTAMLTAFNNASGDIFYSHFNSYSTESGPHGSSVINEDDWSYPAQPSVGQQVRTHIKSLYASNATSSDTELIYRQPADSQFAHGGIQLNHSIEQIDVEYGNHTWSDQVIKAGMPSPRFDPSTLRKAIADGEYAGVAKTELNGRAVFKLTIRQGGQGAETTTTLWVDVATYLPLREVTESGGYTDETDSAFLAPTAANLAKLNVTIPAGFKRTPTVEG